MLKFENVIKLKNEGNALFINKKFIPSCQSYAKAIEAMITLEANVGIAECEIQSFSTLKSQLFLNLGIANFNLNEIGGNS